MNSSIPLSGKEMSYVEDVDFLLTRYRINEKVNQLLLQCEANIKHYLNERQIIFPEGIKFRAGKIAKGENYLKLPYYILDYPRQFSQESIFALRTMFWWGNYFSVTFHLSGDALNIFRPAVVNRLETLYDPDLYIYRNADDPWQHHITETNYRQLKDWDMGELRQYIAEVNHFKLCRVLPLQEWNHLPDFTIDFFSKMLSLISLYSKQE
jgi:hypothetical protein